jgi:hypothetical protein
MQKGPFYGELSSLPEKKAFFLYSWYRSRSFGMKMGEGVHTDDD